MTNFNIPNMTCGHCKETVEKTISGLDGSAKVVVDLDTHNVEVDTLVATETIIAALKTAGYEAKHIQA